MPQEGFKRKLTAILSADAVGYSRLMRDDEEATVRDIAAHRVLIAEIIQQHHGRVIDSPGDNILAEFASVVDAVNGAIKIQGEIKKSNADTPKERRMEFRIGINLGDVIEEEERIYGDGVNIAARVEGLAAAGGISISGTVYEHIKDKLSLGYHNLGEQNVKNIPEPVRVYRLLTEPEDAGKLIGEEKTKARKWHWAAFGAIALILIMVSIFAIWNYYFRPSFEPASVEKMAFPLPEKPSIAVLPFDNMSGDPEQEYFSDGITEQIISSLSKIPKLFVVARNSTFTYKGKPVKINKVAEELGVQYVMEGSVQKFGNRIRITAQLIDALTGHHVWAERYERDFKDIFALQDEITTEILRAVQLEVTEGLQTFYWKKLGTGNLKCIEKNLKGIAAMGQLTKQNNVYARQLFEEAIALDPEFVWPYVNLGWTHFWDVYYRWSQSPKISLGKAFELAQKALAREERIDLAHSLLGSIYYMSRKYEKALAEAERAVSLNPNGAAAYMILASIVSQLGRWEDGITFGLNAIRLNPVPSLGQFHLLGRAHFMIGHYEEAISWCKKALNVNPNFLPARAFLAACYSSLNRQTEADVEAEEIIRINPGFNLESYVKTLHYKDQSDVDRYIAALLKAGLPEYLPLKLPDKPSIAVLAFDNLSGDPEQEYFSDGIAENIITALSKVGNLFVIARNSSFTYRGKPVKVQQVSQELGVRYVLEGSVQKSGDRVRITAQLIDAKNGQHLWAEKYDRELKDIFALQDQITMKVLTAVQVVLTEGERALLKQKEPKSLEAYLKVLKGRVAWRCQCREGNDLARNLVSEAIVLEPEYSAAYSLGSRVYFMDAWLSPDKRPFSESIKLAMESAQKAIELDPSDSIAHGLLCYLYTYPAYKLYEQAIAQGQKALELVPNSADAHFYLGTALAYDGRYEEAIRIFKNMFRLNPRHQNSAYHIHSGLAYLLSGQYDSAISEYNKAIQIAPKSPFPYMMLAPTYVLSKQEKEAQAAAEKLLERNPEFSVVRYEKRSQIRKKEDLSRIVEAMRKAGLPE